MTINLSQLKAFVSVASVGSFTKAARTLNLSQSNLSMQVATLEKSYNIKLLERKKGEVCPTALGRDLADIGKQIFSLQDQAAELVKNANALDKGTLRIGCDSPVTVFPYLARFKEQYPNVEVSLYLGSAHEVLVALKACKIDIALMSEQVDETQFIAKPLKQSSLGCVCPIDHPFAKKKKITFADLDGEKLVMRMVGSQTRAVFDAASKLADFTPTIALEVSSREGVMEGVRHGFGVGLVWQNEFNDDPRLKAIPLGVDGGNLTISQVVGRERENRGILRAFVDFLEK